MNVECPQFEQYMARFQALAEAACPWPEKQRPSLGSVQRYLCLFGENGLSMEEEFSILEELATALTRNALYKLEVDTDYWQDTILFVP
ncbi:MAG: hypothetical protein SFZ03_03320 [Candidatus Melainabacteria bacterium]|nr:hypothetical protein [Candidatus Melainabacteria bacterium]